jgi:hypothetical protein
MRGHRASAATNRAGKIGASRRVSTKIAGWGVEALDRIARYALRAVAAVAAPPAIRAIFARKAAHADYSKGLHARRRTILSNGEPIVKIKYDLPRRGGFSVSPWHKPRPEHETRLTPH